MSESVLSMPALDLSGGAAVTASDDGFSRNADGSLRLKKDGTPAKKRGRAKGYSATEAVNNLLGADDEAKGLAEGLVAEVASPEELASLLAATFALPAALVDESFDLTDASGEPNRRCKIAAKRLFPICKKYGTAGLVKWLPEIIAVWGIIELAKPSVGPVLEIAAGVRQPLIFRKPDEAPGNDAPPPSSPS